LGGLYPLPTPERETPPFASTLRRARGSAPGCFDGLAVPVGGQTTPLYFTLGPVAARPAPAVQWKIYPLTYKLTIERRGA